MDKTTMPADQASCRFLMEIAETEISTFTEEGNYETASVMCEYYIQAFQKWKALQE